MSRHLAVLGITPSINANSSSGVQATARSSEYTALIQRLFQGPSSVAIIGAGFANGVTVVCEGLASELSRLGRRVVLVSVNALLQTGPINLSEETAAVPGVGRNVWIWPSPPGQQTDLLKSRSSSAAKNWLDSLRQSFDSVLLDCPALETAPGAAAIAAMAESAVLAVDAGRTPKHQVLLNQRLLQLSGVNLVGCILVNAK